MKRFFFILFFLISGKLIYAQGFITLVELDPIQPTEDDTLYFYVHIDWTSGPCFFQSKSLNIVGNNFVAASLHCDGQVWQGCWSIDTFKVNPQVPGNYTFIMDAYRGLGTMGCSASLLPDDTARLDFTVGIANSLEEYENDHFSVYPNPSNGIITIDLEESTILFGSKLDLQVLSMDGALKKVLSIGSDNNFSLDLPSGIFLIQLMNEKEVIQTKKIIVLE